METELYDEEIEIKNFLDGLYINGNCSETETKNFLHVFCDYVLAINGIYPEYENIEFHYTDKIPDHIGAFVTPSVCNHGTELKFDVYFRKAQLIMHDIYEFEKTLFLIFVAGHEFRHIVQLIKYPNSMIEFTKAQNNLSIVKNSTTAKCKTHREARRVSRLFDNHERPFVVLSSTEVDADQSSYAIIFNLLERIASAETDEGLLEYYDCLYADFKNLQNSRKKFYHIKRDQFDKTFARLKSHKVNAKDIDLT